MAFKAEKGIIRGGIWFRDIATILENQRARKLTSKWELASHARGLKKRLHVGARSNR